MRKKIREYANTIGLDLHSFRTVSSLTYTIFSLQHRQGLGLALIYSAGTGYTS